MSRVLIAPDKFKGSLTALEVAEAIRRGIAEHDPTIECRVLPLADGGDGSVAAALNAGYHRLRINSYGPTGQPLGTDIAFNHHTAILESASICGLSLLPHDGREPISSSSYGIGAGIRTIIEELSPNEIVIGLGGTASTDGGAGMLLALGARFYDAQQVTITEIPEQLHRVTRVDLDPVHHLLEDITIVGATDVLNPLLGPDGAATVYGPQKGASTEQVQQLEERLQAFARSTDPVTAEVEGAGSAGGLGYAVLLLEGRLVSGGEYFLDLLHFNANAGWADLIITGEGCLDAQTKSGKLISCLARRAPTKNIRAAVGKNLLNRSDSLSIGLEEVYAVADVADTDPSRNSELSRRILKDMALNLLTGNSNS